MAKTISVIYCFPRSGGTLLNQCLLCHSRNVVLSEVNPAGSVVEPDIQAAEWFGILKPREAEALHYRTYLDKLAVISDQAARAGRSLCVRDWPAVNFLTSISAGSGVPSELLEQRIYLREAGYQLREVALVRRSEAVFNSIRKHIPELRSFSIKAFARAYRAYLEQIATVKKYHLEDLVKNQQSIVSNICSDLGLAYAPDFIKRFYRIKHVTGNTTLPKPADSARWTTIRAAESKASANRTFQELDLLAGYAHAS